MPHLGHLMKWSSRKLFFACSASFFCFSSSIFFFFANSILAIYSASLSLGFMNTSAFYVKKDLYHNSIRRENDRCRAEWPLWLAVSASRQCFPVIVDSPEIAGAPLPHQHSSSVLRT